METGIQSSFIPKEAGQTVSANHSVSGGAGLPELFVLASIILLVASGALGGGVFLYRQFLQSQMTSKSEQLKRAEDAFQPSLVQQLMRLDQRMHAADSLLGAHLAPSVFFGSLDQATLTTVSFGGLTLDASNPAQVSIKMSGVARSVNSIALQASLFNKNSVITNPIFSSIDHQEDGVHFALQALVNASALSYAQMINGTNPQTPQPALQAPSAPASPFTAPPATSTPPAGTPNTPR